MLFAQCIKLKNYMQKYRLLSVHRKGVEITNIGDYIQALAARQFLPRVDGYVDRELLKSYSEEPCKMIMNGWYMHDTTQWPPTDLITPLFVALHMNVSAREGMLSKEGIDYLKGHQPIGCRDINTADVLKSKGINSYFSGCLTLTLGYKYHSAEKEEKCYIVDPKIPISKDLVSIIKDVFYFILKRKDVNTVTSKLFSDVNMKKKRLASRFLRTYSKHIELKTLVEAEYIQQQNKFYATQLKTEEERLQEAERLVKKYAKARLVITSRIHCALPCLGLETPVVFVYNEDIDEVSKCRFGGLKELFNTFVCSPKRVKPSFTISKKLSVSNPCVNKEDWRSLSEGLIKKCLEFTKENGN